MWFLIILIVIIILGVLEQITIKKHLYKENTYIILPDEEPKFYINPYTGNKFLICMTNRKIDNKYRNIYSRRLKPKQLIISQVSKPIYKFFNNLTNLSTLTPLTDLCGLVDPILKTVINPSLKENYYTIYTDDDIETVMFDNKICIFN